MDVPTLNAIANILPAHTVNSLVLDNCNINDELINQVIPKQSYFLIIIKMNNKPGLIDDRSCEQSNLCTMLGEATDVLSISLKNNNISPAGTLSLSKVREGFLVPLENNLTKTEQTMYDAAFFLDVPCKQ